ILSILFPIAGFAAAGFEHSIANMFFIPAGLMIQASTGVHADLTLLMAVRNIGLATVGNIIGGAVPVAMAYGYVYRTD
ncbi:MAG: formate/nitrite transporter family protein, partial [Spirochaetales bacterium]|nr:formate/nitrite transporter family protein [Spirochaetales bacterium]